jgi:DNA (cytosine-5)-methyltransferase 1
MTIRYFSMFSGIGGFELGIERAAAKLGLTAECVGYSEIDKHAIKTYEEHFNHDNYGDATGINAADLPNFDLLVGGFPCQAFSIAGKRRGFEEARGTLFFDIARILKAKQPQNFILENVKGLLSHDGGRTVRTIIGTLTELGYGVEWQVLNSKNHGVPQNRERIYIVGHLGGPGERQVFPFTQESEGNLREITRGRSASQRIYEPFLSPTLNPGVTSGGPELAKFAIVRNRRGEDVGYTQRDIATCLDANYAKGIDYHGARTGIAHLISGDLSVRKLTPTECERLQGFPDGWSIGADTQRYKQCGNAVTVNVRAGCRPPAIRTSGGGVVSDDYQTRIGIGKISGLGTTGPWYVTLYNRALTDDRVQGWFWSLPEATTFAHQLLAACRAARIEETP